MPEWGDFAWNDDASPDQPRSGGVMAGVWWGDDVTPQTEYLESSVQTPMPWNGGQGVATRMAVYRVWVLDKVTWEAVHEIQGILADGAQRTFVWSDGLVQQEDIAFSVLDPTGFYRTGAGAVHMKPGTLLRLDLAYGDATGHYAQRTQMVYRISGAPEVSDDNGAVFMTVHAMDWAREILTQSVYMTASFDQGGPIPAMAPRAAVILGAETMAREDTETQNYATAMFHGDQFWYRTWIGIYWAMLLDACGPHVEVVGSLRQTRGKFHLAPITYQYQAPSIGGQVTRSYTLQPYQQYEFETFPTDPSWLDLLALQFGIGQSVKPGIWMMDFAVALFYRNDGTLLLATQRDRQLGIPGLVMACTDAAGGSIGVPVLAIKPRYREPTINRVQVRGTLISPNPASYQAAEGGLGSESAEAPQTPPPGLGPASWYLEPPELGTPTPMPKPPGPDQTDLPTCWPVPEMSVIEPPVPWPDHDLPPDDLPGPLFVSTDWGGPPPDGPPDAPYSHGEALAGPLPTQRVVRAPTPSVVDHQASALGIWETSGYHIGPTPFFAPLAEPPSPGDPVGNAEQIIADVRMVQPPGVPLFDLNDTRRTLVIANFASQFPLNSPGEWVAAQQAAAVVTARQSLATFARGAMQLQATVDSAFPFLEGGQHVIVHYDEAADHLPINGIFLLTQGTIPWSVDPAELQLEWMGDLAVTASEDDA